MYSKLGVLVISALIGQSAFASYDVQCGSKTDVESGQVKAVMLNLSSEDENFNGPASKRTDGWTMDYNGKEYPPNKATAKATAKATVNKDGHTTSIEVTVIIANTPSGPVGEKLVLTAPYDDEPTLDIYNIGGITGPLKTQSYKCLSFLD